MQLIGKIAAGVALFLGVIFIAVPFFISKEGIIETASKQVHQTIGRKLTVSGDANLSVFPSLTLELNDVTLSNFDESDKPNMASMGTLALHVPWLSVFTGELNISQFVIKDLDLLLEKTPQGKANWNFFAAKTNTESDEQASDESTSENSGTKLPGSFDVSLGQVEIVNGQINYHDRQAGTQEIVEQLSIQLLLPSLDQPFELRGSVLYKEKQFQITSVLDNPRKLIEGSPFDTSVAFNSDLINLNYSGSVMTAPMDLQGELAVAGTSLKALTSWSGIDLNAKEEAFNSFSLSAGIRFAGQTFSLSKLTASLDDLQVQGESNVSLTSPIKLTARVDLGDLDLNPYLPEVTQNTVPETETEVAEQKPAPVVWDSTPIDLSALSSVNVDLVIKSNSLKARKITLGENQFSLQLQDSVMSLSMDKFSAYDGVGNGKVVLNARSNPYQINTQFTLSDINAKPLLSDAIDFERLMGKGGLNWQLETKGNTQKAFIESLNGSLAFDFKDGAVQGANIAAIAESAANIMQGNLSAVNLDQNFSAAEKTDFASLSGSFQFNNGVGTSDDLALLNPLVRVTGNGNLDLPATLLDFRTKSSLVSSLEGQGGQLDASGITIPIKIKGPFHEVKIRPDVSSEIKEKLKDKVKNKLLDLFG